ncbi:MAG TPA: YncE family protein, partial [Methanocella sp.]|nr:YncE family protein [Methanocella sp.]
GRILDGDGMLYYNIELGMPCNGAAISPDGQYVYATHRLNDSVSIIDTSTDKVIGVLPTAADTPGHIAVDHTGRYLYVDCGGKYLSIIDLPNGTVTPIGITTTGHTYQNIAVNPVTSYVYAASVFDDRVYEVYGPGKNINYTFNYNGYYPFDVTAATQYSGATTIINPLYDFSNGSIRGNASGYYRLSHDADLYNGWKVQPIPSIIASPGSSEGSPPPSPGANIELNPEPGSSMLHPGVHAAGSEGVLSYDPQSALQRKALNPQPVPPGAFDLGKILTDIANYFKNAFGLER